MLFTVLTIIAVAAAGCSPKAAEPATTKVVYLINGSLGDNAFYDSGQKGMDQLKADYGVEIRTIECGYDPAQYEPSIEAAVGYSDVIFVISYGFEDLVMEYADKYPEKIFVNLDTVVQNEKGTVTSVDYIEEESAFLAGVVAGMVTLDTGIPNVNEQKLIGAVGGDQDPVIDEMCIRDRVTIACAKDKFSFRFVVSFCEFKLMLCTINLVCLILK